MCVYMHVCMYVCVCTPLPTGWRRQLLLTMMIVWVEGWLGILLALPW
jgi:hypothetical protein